MSGSLDLLEVKTSSSRLSDRFIQLQMLQAQALAAFDALLSIRELEILELLAEGRTNKEIAAVLYISFETVKTHVSHIRGKMAARNRTEAACLYTALQRQVDRFPSVQDDVSFSMLAAESGEEYEAPPRLQIKQPIR